MSAKDVGGVSAQLAEHSRKEDRLRRAHLTSIAVQFEAIARGDFEAVFQEAAPDVKLEIFAPPEFPFIRFATGVQQLQEAIRHNFGTVEDQQPDIRDVFSEGNSVVLLGRERGRIRVTGTAYEVEFVHKFHFEEGRLTEVRVIVAYRG